MLVTLRSKTLILGLFCLLAPFTPALAAVSVQPGVVQPLPPDVGRSFQMLTYDTENPMASVLQYSYNNPGRTMTETVVDNEAEFDQRLYAIPNGVNLTTNMGYLLQRHGEFLNLASSNEMLITVAVHGDLAALESFALNSLGITKVGHRIVASGTTSGMLLIQYYKHYNTAALLGSETYTQGRRATYPTEYPVVRGSDLEANKAAGPWLWIIIKIIKAALEDPFWNDAHYLSGETLGCLGVGWGTAFEILWEWEMFEQWINEIGREFGVELEVGEDIWGIIWDLIWGMTGYVDGLLGWWD